MIHNYFFKNIIILFKKYSKDELQFQYLISINHIFINFKFILLKTFNDTRNHNHKPSSLV